MKNFIVVNADQKVEGRFDKYDAAMRLVMKLGDKSILAKIVVPFQKENPIYE